MDKLQPIIKNRFWILAGLIVPIAMYGFFSANAGLKAETQKREDELKSVLSGIPGGANDPNEEYAQGLSKINEAYTKAVDDSILEIWYKQKEAMTWPPIVQQHVPPKFMGDFQYAGVVAYQAAYEQVMKDLQARVEPVMPVEGPMGGGANPMLMGPMGPGKKPAIADVPWKQKVMLAASIPQARFGRMRATSEQIWNAQIDVWLLRQLFDAVARLNEDKDSITEAVLRRIDKIELVGGDGEPAVTGGSSGGEGGGYGEMGEMMSRMSSYGGGGGLNEGGATGSAASAVPIDFSPAQEFGSAADASAASEGSGSYGESSPGMMMTASNAAQLRYIADSEDKPYLERGFYMSVILMQDKIPDFLVELANSEWPVSVVRFHVGKNPYYTGARSSSMGPYGSGSYGPGSSLMEYETTSDRMSSMTSGSYGESAFGGVGANAGPTIPGVGNLTAGLPPFVDDALQHPNLVQLDLCGIITMYKQPEVIIAAIDAGEPIPVPSGNTMTSPSPLAQPEAGVAETPESPAAEATVEEAPAVIESLDTLPAADDTSADPGSTDGAGATAVPTGGTTPQETPVAPDGTQN